MKRYTLIAALMSTVCVFSLTLAAAEQKTTAKPAILSGKTVAFITFATGSDADKLKNQASAFFTNWKRYQVSNDPARADLIVLLGPMPRHVDEEAWDAVLAGKPLPVEVNIKGAPSQFAVFDAAEAHGDVANPGLLKPLWSTEMHSDDVIPAAKKYKSLVANIQDSYDHMGLTFEKCRMIGLRCAH